MSTAVLERSAGGPPAVAEEPAALPEPAWRGRLSIADRVVEKIAVQAAGEVEHAAGVRRRVLGQTVGRLTEESSARASADVDGELVTLSMSISVEYPASVRRVAADVRARVGERVRELCGLEVAEVRIDVPSFLTKQSPRPRVV